jgi:O-antigen/teichoic acid export membrane protein
VAVANAEGRALSDVEGVTRSGGLSEEAAEDVVTLAKGGGIQITGQFAQRGLTFVLTFVAVRVLVLGAFGLYRQIAQVLAILSQLGLAGFNYAAVHFIARSRSAHDPSGVRGAARAAVIGTAVASSLVFAALLIWADPLAMVFEKVPQNESEFVHLLRIGALYIPMYGLMQTLRYCTQAYKTMVPSVKVGNIIQPTAYVVLGVGALAAGFAVAGLVLSLVASAAIGALAGAWYYRKILTEEERAAKPRSKPGRMLRFALPQLGASLLGIQSLGIGVIILGIFSSNIQVAFFGLALALQGPGSIFLSGIVNIWAPVVSDLYEKGDLSRLDSLYKTITRWVGTFSFPIYAALIVEADLFVRLFGGSKYAGTDAALVVAVLAVGNIFYSGTGPTGYVLSMTGRPGINFVNSLVAVGIYVGLGAAVVPQHGAIGMAIVDAVVTTLVNLVRVLEAKLLVGVQPFGRAFLKPVVATLAAAAVLLGWRWITGSGTLAELVGLAVAGVVYFIALRAFGIDEEERYVWDRIKTRAALRRGRR